MRRLKRLNPWIRLAILPVLALVSVLLLKLFGPTS